MWDMMHDVRNGKETEKVSNAASNAAGKIISTVKLQLEYAKLTGQKPDAPMLRIEEKPAIKE